MHKNKVEERQSVILLLNVLNEIAADKNNTEYVKRGDSLPIVKVDINIFQHKAKQTLNQNPLMLNF